MSFISYICIYLTVSNHISYEEAIICIPGALRLQLPFRTNHRDGLDPDRMQHLQPAPSFCRTG